MTEEKKETTVKANLRDYPGASQIVGIAKIKRKDGSGYSWKLYLMEQFSDYELANTECSGMKTADEYISSYDCSGLKVGDIVKIYKVQNGQFLRVDEIRVLAVNG